MRARVGLLVPDRGSDDRLGGDISQVPSLWGEHGPLGGGPTDVSSLARRAVGQGANSRRDVAAERDLIRAVIRRAHQRRARRRPLVTWVA
jgi:hypothetical protein